SGYIRMIFGYRLSNLFQKYGLAGTRRSHQQCPLPFANWGYQIHNAHINILRIDTQFYLLNRHNRRLKLETSSPLPFNRIPTIYLFNRVYPPVTMIVLLIFALQYKPGAQIMVFNILRRYKYIIWFVVKYMIPFSDKSEMF